MYRRASKRATGGRRREKDHHEREAAQLNLVMRLCVYKGKWAVLRSNDNWVENFGLREEEERVAKKEARMVRVSGSAIGMSSSMCCHCAEHMKNQSP
jgi:hypothetical protein